MQDIENSSTNLHNINLDNNQLRQRMINKNNKMKIITMVIIFVLVILICFPIMICDLYYGYNDNTCVSNSAEPLNLTLKDYLITSGFIALGEIIFLIAYIGILLNDEFTLTCCSIIGVILFYFTAIFSIIWNIIGGVIFWAYMDNTTCSSTLFNYVFTSLIIKYVFCFFGSTQSNKSDN